MFPPAAADHKYSHATGAYRVTSTVKRTGAANPRYSSGRSWSVWSRLGPTPTAATGAPESSSMALT